MRTDSNTILSLSSDVPAKTRKSPKEPRESGAAFENDFNKAKEVFSPKSASAEAASPEKTQVTESASKPPPDGARKEDEPLASNKETIVSNEVLEEEDSMSENGSGKVLQAEGDESPIVATVEGGFEGELAFLSSLDSEAHTQEADSVLGVQDDSIKNVTSAELTSHDLDQTLVPSVAMLADEAKEPNMSDLSDIELKSASVESLNSPNQPIAPLSPLSKSTVPEPSEGSEDLLYDGDELSWVLSQMDGASAKAIPKSVDVASDAVQNGVVTSSLIAGAMNRNGRPESSSVNVPLDASIAGAVGNINSETSETLLLDDDLVINEPIELRKKEQDVMIGRMSSQLDGKMADDSVIGGLNSSLQSTNSAARSAIGLGVAANNQQANLTMNLPPSHPGWASEISQKVAWIARDGGHTAHIRLDPPELGSLTVKVSVDTDSTTQVSFVAATPQARDLLESQMNRLRDMLAQQGMDLSRANVDVSQQDASGTQKDTEQDSSSSRNRLASQDEIDDDLISSNVSYVSTTGVDYYA